MKMGVRLAHHDHDYVERRGGWPLLTHLRGAPPRVRYRREAIERAWIAFCEAEEDGTPDSETGGLGLIVIQRALLAAEDLGGLLYAFDGSQPWDRLRQARVPDIDATFERAADNPSSALEAFRLIDPATAEDDRLSALERGALGRLRTLVVRRWQVMLRRSAELWLAYRHVAKATMHGFPIVAGGLVVGPPPAGALAAGVRAPKDRRFALAATSVVRSSTVVTDRVIIPLNRAAVLGARIKGKTAARLVGELCELQAGTIMSGHAGAVPLRLTRRLSADDSRIIEALVAREDT